MIKYNYIYSSVNEEYILIYFFNRFRCYQQRYLLQICFHLLWIFIFLFKQKFRNIFTLSVNEDYIFLKKMLTDFVAMNKDISFRYASTVSKSRVPADSFNFFSFKLLLYRTHGFNWLSKCFSCIYTTGDLHITARISNKC